MYLKADYQSKFVFIDEPMSPKQIKIESTAAVKIGSRIVKKLDYEILLQNNKVQSFIIHKGKQIIQAEWIG